MNKYLLNFTIKAKLIFGLVSLLILSIFLVANNILTLHGLSERIDQIVLLRMPTQKAGLGLETSVEKSHTDLIAGLLTKDSNYFLHRKLFWEQHIHPDLEKLRKISTENTNLNSLKKLNKIEKLLENLNTIQVTIEQMFQEGVPEPQIIRWLEEREEPTAKKLMFLIRDMTASQNYLLNEDVIQIRILIGKNIQQQILILIFSILIACVLIIVIVTNISNAVQSLVKRATQLRKSNEKPIINSEFKGELGKVGYAMEKMALELYETNAAELKEINERLSLIVDGVSDGIWDWDVSNHSVKFSLRWKQMRGYEAHEISDREGEWKNGIHPDDLDQVMTAINAHFDGKTTHFEEEYRVKCKDGSWKWVLDRGLALRDEYGQVVRMAGSETDITKRKMAQTALYESEHRFRQLAENINEVFWLGSPDGKQVFYVSPAYEKNWGKNAQSLYDNGMSWFEAAHPDDRACLQKEFISSAENMGNEFHFTPYRIINADEEIRWIDARAYPIRNEQGKLTGIAGIAEDISQHKNLIDEQEIILDSMLDSVITINGVGDVLSFNKSAELLFGYAAEEIIGGNVNRLMPSPYTEHHDDYLRRYIETGKAKIIGQGREVEGLTKDGKHFPMLLSVVEISSHQRGRRRFIGSCLDLTEIKSKDEQLRRSQKMDAIGQLTGGIAHDFNNILGVILGNTTLLKRQLEPNEKIDKYISSIEKSGQRAADLTKQLLGFSRKRNTQVFVTDVNAIIRGMESLIRRSITPAIDIEVRLFDDAYLVEVDPGDLEDSLLNLVINARDAMSSGGKLIIETKNKFFDSNYAEQNPRTKAGDYLQLSVSDTGNGITPEIKERIFEPFYTTKVRGKGTGLGLSMVFGFIERSHGYVRVYSEKEIGTSFHLYLPRSLDLEKDDQGIQMDSGELPKGNETILIVDDEPELLEVAKEMLEALGYKTWTASNGQEAIDCLLKVPTIELLFSDVVMPGSMNGYQLAEKAININPNLKILLTSGYTDKVVAHDGQARFKTNILSKPYTETELSQQLRSTLGS